MHWIFVSPQISYGEALTLNVIVLGGRAFEKYLGLCELKSGISVLIGKETRALSHLPLPLSLSLSLSLSLPCKDTSEKVVIWSQEESPNQEPNGQ